MFVIFLVALNIVTFMLASIREPGIIRGDHPGFVAIFAVCTFALLIVITRHSMVTWIGHDSSYPPSDSRGWFGRKGFFQLIKGFHTRHDLHVRILV